MVAIGNMCAGPSKSDTGAGGGDAESDIDCMRKNGRGGIAMCGMKEKPSAKLIKRAGQALYRAKRENKGCCLWEEWEMILAGQTFLSGR